VSESAATPLLPLGVWRRGPSDWAYRVEVEGYGSIAGVGFESRNEALRAMQEAREARPRVVLIPTAYGRQVLATNTDSGDHPAAQRSDQ
jgi:hypothetical protein